MQVPEISNEIDSLVEEAVFASDNQEKEKSQGGHQDNSRFVTR